MHQQHRPGRAHSPRRTRAAHAGSGCGPACIQDGHEVRRSGAVTRRRHPPPVPRRRRRTRLMRASTANRINASVHIQRASDSPPSFVRGIADVATGAASRRHRARSSSGSVATSASTSAIAAGRTARIAARTMAGASKALAAIGASTTMTPSRSDTVTAGSTPRSASDSAAAAIHGDFTAGGAGTTGGAPANLTMIRRSGSPAETP